MRDQLMKFPARTRGLIYIAAGIVLAVIGAVVINAFASRAAAAGVDVSDDKAAQVVGWIGAPFAFAMAFGIALTYMGLVKVAIGPSTDKLEWDRITGVGLLYVLGFIGALILTGYVVLVRWRMHIF